MDHDIGIILNIILGPEQTWNKYSRGCWNLPDSLLPMPSYGFQVAR